MPRSTTPQHPKRLVSLAEAAGYASITEKTLRKWIAQGSLTGFRLGPKLLRVDLNDVDAMLRPLHSGGDVA